VLKRSVADLRALAHPLRLRMMELFAESPKTTKQVAELLGQPPTRLYHHVAALERAGLLVLKETRKNRGTVEKWYTGVAQQLRGAGSGRSAAARAARRAVAATVLEQAKQEVVSMPPGAKEAALLARLVVAAPRSKIPVIRKRLFETVQSLRRDLGQGPGTGKDADADCERWAVTVAFAPVKTPRRTGSGVRSPTFCPVALSNSAGRDREADRHDDQ
jgi:DNA-binding transcriptional ArsR family regulator